MNDGWLFSMYLKAWKAQLITYTNISINETDQVTDTLQVLGNGCGQFYKQHTQPTEKEVCTESTNWVQTKTII